RGLERAVRTRAARRSARPDGGAISDVAAARPRSRASTVSLSFPSITFRPPSQCGPGPDEALLHRAHRGPHHLGHLVRGKLFYLLEDHRLSPLSGALLDVA